MLWAAKHVVAGSHLADDIFLTVPSAPTAAFTAQACFRATCVSCHYRWCHVNTDRQTGPVASAGTRSLSHGPNGVSTTCLCGKTKSIKKNIIACGICAICNYLNVLDLQCLWGCVCAPSCAWPSPFENKAGKWQKLMNFNSFVGKTKSQHG